MDSDALVKAGHALVQELEKRSVVVKGAVWVTLPEIAAWRLWIIPSKMDQKQFYGAVAASLANVNLNHPGLSISDIEIKKESDPAIKAIAAFGRHRGLGSIYMARNMINGFYTPDGIVLRMDL